MMSEVNDMSFKRVSAVMDIDLTDGLAKWVLVTFHHENNNTGHCFPSIDRLVRQLVYQEVQ